MRVIREPKWLVPVDATTWVGKRKKFTVRVFAPVTEWVAQEIASRKALRDYTIGALTIGWAWSYAAQVDL